MRGLTTFTLPLVGKANGVAHLRHIICRDRRPREPPKLAFARFGEPLPRLSVWKRCYFPSEHLIRKSPEIPILRIAASRFDCVPPCHSECSEAKSNGEAARSVMERNLGGTPLRMTRASEKGFQRGKRVQNFAKAKFKPVCPLACFFAQVCEAKLRV